MIRLRRECYRIYLNEEFKEHLDELLTVIGGLSEEPSLRILRDSRSTFAAVFEAFGRKLHIKRAKPRSAGYLLRHMPPRHGRILYNFKIAERLQKFKLPSLIPVAALFRRHLLTLQEATLITVYVEGRHLSEMLCDDAQRGILEAVGEAIAYFHNASVVHGDLKPSNILITNRREAVLCDYDNTRILHRKITVEDAVGDLARIKEALKIEQFLLLLDGYTRLREITEPQKSRMGELLQRGL